AKSSSSSACAPESGAPTKPGAACSPTTNEAPESSRLDPILQRSAKLSIRGGGSNRTFDLPSSYLSRGRVTGAPGPARRDWIAFIARLRTPTLLIPRMPFASGLEPARRDRFLPASERLG